MKYLGLLAALFCISVQAQTVDLSVTPINGVGSVVPTLTWTSTGCATLTATGGWSGTKSASGSQVMPAIVSNTTYGLTCTPPPGDTSMRLSWTPPTQNTDGTALLNLTDYLIYIAPSVTALATATPVRIPAPTSTYQVNNLTAGTWHAGVKAMNSVGVQSVMSNTASKVITTSAPVSDTVTVAVTAAPNPPTGLTTISTVAFETRWKWGGLALWREGGSIPFGTPCYSDKRLGNTKYYEVPREAVTAYRRQALSAVVVALCG